MKVQTRLNGLPLNQKRTQPGFDVLNMALPSHNQIRDDVDVDDATMALVQAVQRTEAAKGGCKGERHPEAN